MAARRPGCAIVGAMSVEGEAVDIAAEVHAELCGPGGPWETAVEDVLGEQLLVFVNRHRSARAMFEDVTSKHAEHECLVMGDTRLTYADVAERVAATARRLADRYGVGPGDRVATLAANSPEWVITFYATISLGGIVAALNGWWTAPEIDHAITLAHPKVLVGDTRRLERATALPDGLPVLDMDLEPAFFAPEAGATMPDQPIDEDDPALILFTSGTTGQSKGALVSHRGLVGFVDGTTHNATEKRTIALRRAGIDPAQVPETRDINLNTSPLFHISGLLAGILLNMQSGTTIVFREGRFDPADVLALIERERITAWSAIGSMAPRVLAHPDLATTDTSSLTRVGSGGAHTPPHLQEQLREAFPNAAMSIGQGYGSSESVGVITSIGGPEFQANPTATGRPCLGFELEIRDPMGNVMPDGEEGEVHVRSAYTMLRYWRNPEATAETIKAGRWLAMGDIGRMEDGMLYLNARARDMIIRSGENVYPVEIEQRLGAHPDVDECAVVGSDHPELGQEVKAIVVTSGGPLDVEALDAWCRETLAGYKVPTLWERRGDPLPRTASGKVVKGALTGDRDISDHQD
jgi:acyl-CoA synthetase (AMP-forming)/AMP-acid ligase II